MHSLVVCFPPGCRVPPGCGCDAAVPLAVQAELYALLGCVELGQVAHHTDGRLVELRSGGEACALSGAPPPPPPRPPQLPAGPPPPLPPHAVAQVLRTRPHPRVEGVTVLLLQRDAAAADTDGTTTDANETLCAAVSSAPNARDAAGFVVYASPWGVLPAGATAGCAPPWAALTRNELVACGASEQGDVAHETDWLALLNPHGDWAVGELAPLTTSSGGDRSGYRDYAGMMNPADWCAAYNHPAADGASPARAGAS